MKRIAPSLFAVAVLAAWPAVASAQSCSASCGSQVPQTIQWPATGAPVWQMSVLTPCASSGNNGSGIELRNVSYNGHLVFKRAHNPVLNVKYIQPCGCDCYRDWIDEERKFQVYKANPTPGGPPVLATSSGPGNLVDAVEPPLTVCDNGGSNGDVPAGTGFCGVAIERLADRMTLTTQLAAGWYRYLIKWTFFANGRIEPRFGFGAVSNSCVSGCTHRHHTYWRLDFDVDGALNDALSYGDVGLATARKVSPEQMRTLGSTSKGYTVWDTVTQRGYKLIPGAETVASPVGSSPSNGGPTWNGTTYPFDVTDTLILQYKESTPGVPAEVNDGVGLSSCALTSSFLNFMNGEALNDNGDVVLWYRGGAEHRAGELNTCPVVGPALVPVGDWAP